jgi:hypothetical protein
MDPGIIGGLLLPVLGALPDGLMIVISGAFGTSAEAQTQIVCCIQAALNTARHTIIDNAFLMSWWPTVVVMVVGGRYGNAGWKYRDAGMCQLAPSTYRIQPF